MDTHAAPGVSEQWDGDPDNGQSPGACKNVMRRGSCHWFPYLQCSDVRHPAQQPCHRQPRHVVIDAKHARATSDGGICVFMYGFGEGWVRTVLAVCRRLTGSHRRPSHPGSTRTPPCSHERGSARSCGRTRAPRHVCRCRSYTCMGAQRQAVQGHTPEWWCERKRHSDHNRMRDRGQRAPRIAGPERAKSRPRHRQAREHHRHKVVLVGHATSHRVWRWSRG